MNVVIINKSDSTGGAAVVTFRLLNALRHAGINASMLVTEKKTDSPYVELAAAPLRSKVSFLTERLKIFMTKGVTRANLFKIDTASDGLPLHRHPLVRNADVICLNWVNQGMLSLSGLKKLLQTGKPIVWTMHDMWCFTGICHHAGECRRFEESCGNCPMLLKGASVHDISYKTLRTKQQAYDSGKRPIHFVAVSNWLANLAHKSHLLGKQPLSVIPNAFPAAAFEPGISHIPGQPFRILFGAARLDDPIKGFPILAEATRILSEKYPEEAAGMELVTFGNIRNPELLKDIRISHRHLGRIDGEEAIRELYRGANAVVSTSLYETLPGTLVEGQAYGCIPVAFNRGGQSDIIDHLSTGYLADWSDHIDKAAHHIAEGIIWAMSQNKEMIGKRMYESAKARFDERVIAGRYISLFERLISS